MDFVIGFSRNQFVTLVAWLAACLPVVAAAEQPRVTLSGQVLDKQNQPVANITVRSMAYKDVDQTVTDAEGKFTVRVEENRLNHFGIVANDFSGNRMGLFTSRYDAPPSPDDPITISLEACTELPVEVFNAAGEPEVEVIVGGMIASHPVTTTVTNEEGRATLRWPESRIPNILYALKPQVGFDYRIVTSPRDKTHQADWLKSPPVSFQLAPAQTIQVRLVDYQDKPVVGGKLYPWLFNKPGEPDSFNLSFAPHLFMESTNSQGIATFRGIPNWKPYTIVFWPSSKDLTHTRIEFDTEKQAGKLLTVQVDRLIPATGQVRDEQGNPIAGVTVAAIGSGTFNVDNQRHQTKTDSDGTFELMLAPDHLYSFAIRSEKWAAPLLEGIITLPEKPIENLTIAVRPATHLSGRLTVGPEATPIADEQIRLRQEARNSSEFPNEIRPNPGNGQHFSSPYHYLYATTDQDGRYEFFVGPGKYFLIGPSPLEWQALEVFAQPEVHFDLHAPRKETGPFSGKVVTGDPPRPVPNVTVHGIYRASLSVGDLKLEADENGKFAGTRQLRRTVLFAESEDGQLAGMLEIGPEVDEVVIPLKPVGSAEGRLIDHVTRIPLANREIVWGRKVPVGDDNAPWRTAWGGKTTTNENGEFKITGLVLGETYVINMTLSESSWRGIHEVRRTTPEPANLGDLPDRVPRENR